MATLYQRFLMDPAAIRYFLVVGTAKNMAGETIIGRFSDEGWNTDRDESPPHVHFHRVLLQGFNIEASLLQPNGIFGGVSIPTFGAVVADNRDGKWDDWADYSVDGLGWTILMVGYTSRGEKVRYTDAIAEPLLVGVGLGSPEVGDTMKVFIRSRLGLLQQDAQPELYSPPCPMFPGSLTEYASFGDNFDLPNGSWCVEGFFYTEDPLRGDQYLIDKWDGASGWYFDVGAGSGIFRANIAGQTPATSTSAANVVKVRRWTHFAVDMNSSTGTRTLLLDGTPVLTTTSVTGNANDNGHSFRIGRGLYGRMSWLRAFSVSRVSAVRAEMYLPRTGKESNLLWDLRLTEGKGLTLANSKSGSAITGTLTAGCSWVQSAWLAGAQGRRRLVLGEAKDVELTGRDPGQLVFEAGIGPLWGITPYSNANALAGGSYTNRLDLGVTVLLAGSSFGKLTADVSGPSPNGSALFLDGVDDYASGTVSCPAGTMSIVCIAQTRSFQAATRALAGWRNGASAGRRTLAFGSIGPNTLSWQVNNDAAASFIATYGSIPEGEFAVVVGVLNPAISMMELWVNAEKKTEIPVSGTWNTVLSNFATGRLSDVVTPNHLDGTIWQTGIFNTALTKDAQEKIVLRGLRVGDSGFVSGWDFREGTGASTANIVGGQPALTLQGGATWGPARTTVLDLALWFLRRRGISDTLINAAAAAAMLRDLPGAAHVVLDDERDDLAHLGDLLSGVGAALVENGDMLTLDRVRGPLGSASAVRLTERNLTEDPVDPVAGIRPIWGVSVGYRRTHSTYRTEDVASLAASNPERFHTATEEYQPATYTKASVLENFASAEILRINSALNNYRDAERLARLTFPLYEPRQKLLYVTVDTDAAGLRLLGEVLLEVANEETGILRWGGSRYYQVVSLRKEETTYYMVVWRKD